MKLANYFISNFKKNSLENFSSVFYFQKIVSENFLPQKNFSEKIFWKNFQKIFWKIFKKKFQNFSKKLVVKKFWKKFALSKNFNARIIKNFIGDCSWNSFHDKILQSENGLYIFRKIFNREIFENFWKK